MSDESTMLSSSWEIVRLGDICKTTSGGTPSRTRSDFYGGAIPWIKSGELCDGIVSEIEETITDEGLKNSSAKVFTKGSLLIALYGATVGRLGILSRDAATNQAVCGIFPSEAIETKYLFWYLRSIRSELIDKGQGGAQPNISQGIVKDIHIPLAPLKDQLLIVAEIEKQFSRLDETVASLKRIQANLKRYKAAVLKAAVEGKLTEQWRKDHPDVEPADQLLKRINEKRDKWITQAIKEGQSEPKTIRSKLLKHKFIIPDDVVLPPKWESVSLLSACQMVVDCHNKTAPYEDSGIPLIRTTNVRNGRLLLDGVRYVSESTYTFWSKRCPPEPGDILFTREAPMGEVSIIPEGAKLCMGQRMMLLRAFNDLVSVKYIFYAMQNPSFQAYMNTVAIGTGVKHLRVGDVESLVIPLPPLYEQKKIVEEIESRLSITEELETTIEANLKRAERLRQTILQKAFSSGFN